MKVFCCIILLSCVVLEAVSFEEKEQFECSEEGRFADSFDCNLYFECVSNDDSSFTTHKRSCHGKAFNPKTLTCTDPLKVKGCKLREGRHYSPSTRFSKLCKNDTDFACGDCATQVTCSEGKAYETQCESNLRCVEGLSGFKGGVCHLKYKDECRCQEPNTYYQDPYFNGTFFLCQEKDSVPMFYNCPPDMFFDKNTKTCMSQDGLPACTQRGMFVYPNDCKKYFMCTYALEGWVQTRLKCPAGLLFNEYSEVCENPCEWSLSEFKCQAEGRFKNPKDCSQFFECILDLNGEYLKMMRSCPPKHHWNNESQSCVNVVHSECKTETEGPIKQCQKDYESICKAAPSTITPPEAAASSTTSTIGPDSSTSASSTTSTIGPDSSTSALPIAP